MMGFAIAQPILPILPNIMTQGIAESDWKRFRKLHAIALERFCAQILDEIETVNADEGKNAHQRYLDIYKIIVRRDQEMAESFNDLRRSTALMHIVSIYGRGLFTETEWMGFSQEVVNMVQSFDNDCHA
jgi:hypothetical protein